MRMPSGVTDQYIYFVAVDATDLKTRETGLSSFTVYRSRNGAASAAYTTPTINETDVTNMPGVYELLLDEDMTIDSGDDSQEVVLHITHTGMHPVTRVFELYRVKATAGETATIASGIASANVTQWNGTNVATPDTAGYPKVTIKSGTGTGEIALTSGKVAIKGTGIDSASFDAGAITSTAIASSALTASKFATDSITAAAIATDAAEEIADTVTGSSEFVALASYVDTEVAAIKAKTDNLPSDPADESSIQAGITAAQTAILAKLPAALVGGRMDASVGAMANNVITAACTAADFLAEVNAEVVDALNVDTYAESAAVPAATASLVAKIGWLAVLARNKFLQTATTSTLRNDADSASIATATVSDDGTTFTRAEWA